MRYALFFFAWGIFCSLPLHADMDKDRDLSGLKKEGWSQYRLAEFNRAVELFQSLQRSALPGSDHEIEGLYGEASCWNFRRDKRDTTKAIALYDRILKKAPRHPLAAWAALDRVRAQFLGVVDAFERNDDVVRAYREVAGAYEGTPAGEEAFFLQAGQRVPGLNPEEAERLYAETEEYLARHPKSVFRSRLYDVQAACCAVLGRQEERLEKMILALETRKLDENNPQADSAVLYWQIAYTAEFDAGNFALARKYYGRLIREYPKDIRVFGARQALKRMEEVEDALRAGRPVPAPWKEAADS